MALYQTQPDRKLRAKALAKEYGIGGHSHDYLDGSSGFVNHDWKGLEFERYPDHQKITLKWAQVEKYIDLMIQSDRYLTDEEKELVNAEVELMIASIRKRYKLQERLPEQAAEAEKPAEKAVEKAVEDRLKAKSKKAEDRECDTREAGGKENKNQENRKEGSVRAMGKTSQMEYERPAVAYREGRCPRVSSWNPSRF